MLADSGCIFIPVCNYYMQNKFGRSSRNANTSPDSPLFLYILFLTYLYFLLLIYICIIIINCTSFIDNFTIFPI